MANRFSVQPLGGIQSIRGITQGMQGIAENFRQDQEEERRQGLIQQAAEIMERGNPDEIAQFSMQNPEIGESMIGGIKFANESTKANMRDSMRRIVAGEDPVQVIQDRIQMVESQGGDASDTRRELQAAQADPEGYRQQVSSIYAMSFPNEYNAFRAATGQDSSATPAEIRAFEAKAKAAGLEPGTPEYQQAAKIDLGMVPRAGMSAEERIALDPERGEAVASQSGREAAESERGKLEVQADLKPKVEAAVDRAKAEVAQAVKVEGEQRSNARTLAIYDSAMSNLANALSETTTAPGVGWVPAMTANAQIAEGAQAVMAPILKSMFRTAGEGTFTDQDQKMLMDMIPTRSDLPEARAAKIQAIDAVVRAKLGASQSEEPAPAESGSKQSTRIKLDAEGNIIQ